MDKITDEESARAWLETQDHQTQVWMAARAALRGFPGVSFASDALLDQLAFASLRAMLISLAASTCPASEMKLFSEAASTAYAAARSALSAASTDSAAYAAASTAALSALSASTASTAARYASTALSTAAYAAADSAADSAASTSADRYASTAALSAAAAAARSAFGEDATALREDWPKLWQIEDLTPVQPLLDRWPSLKQRFEADRDWQFWAWWYQHLLDGNPPQKLWDLTQRIAREVTEDEWDWDNGNGPAKVAAKIAKIELAYDLEANIRGYEAALETLLRQPVYKGNRDNGGPPIEDLEELHRKADLIQEHLKRLKDELAKFQDPKQEHDPSVFRKIGLFILSFLDTLGGYTIVLADIAAKSYVTASAAEFAVPGSLRAIAELASRLGGG